jgi:cell fate regulator YaaT (PSP1 superfamily)
LINKEKIYFKIKNIMTNSEHKKNDNNFVYVLDRYTNKNIKVLNIDQKTQENIKAGDKIVYSMEDNNQKPSIWIYLWHDIDTDRIWHFTKVLKWEEKDFFEEQNKFALKIFPLFKKKFKEEFKNSIPVTARFHIYLDQLYFYFYSEERYVFTDFVKKLREKIWKNIFLFQVWARDMVKMDPRTDFLPCGADGIIPMHCKTTMPLPSIEMENLILQHLEWRDIERLKWRCGKLKCSLIYELYIYKEESKKYPPKWSQVKFKKWDVEWIATSYNIMTWDVTIKTKDGEIFRIPTWEVNITKLPDPKIKTDEEKELEKIKWELEG